MPRFLALACILALGALGCARQPTAPIAGQAPVAVAGPLTASVDAGPPACDALHARINSTETQLTSEAHTWLAAPVRMVETRRLRVLRARADALGCPS